MYIQILEDVGLFNCFIKLSVKAIMDKNNNKSRMSL